MKWNIFKKKNKRKIIPENDKIRINKDEFYSQAKSFFEEGLITEVYSSDIICICNMANSFYAAFNYSVSEAGPIGIIIKDEQIKPLIEDDSFFDSICISKAKDFDEFRKSTVILHQRTYEGLKIIKKEQI